MKNKSVTELITELDYQRVRRSFDAVVSAYDDHAVLQREIADRLLENLDFIKLQPHTILDVGAGTGYCTRQLMQRYPSSRVLAVDIAESMLVACRHNMQRRSSLLQRFKKRVSYSCANAIALPFKNNTVDFIFSNLTLQWCPDLQQVFREFYRVLRPNGLLMFSSFGPDTLCELRHAWQQLDHYTHVNQFVDMHDIGDELVTAKFADPVMDMEKIIVTYDSVVDIMRDLKSIGAHNINTGRNHGLTGKGKLKKLEQLYEFLRSDKLLPVTHEILYGHAWVSHDKQHQSPPQTVSISLDAIK